MRLEKMVMASMLIIPAQVLNTSDLAHSVYMSLQS